MISTNPSPTRRTTYFVPYQSKESTTNSRRVTSLPEGASCLSRFSTRMEAANLATDNDRAVRSHPTEKPRAIPTTNAIVVASHLVKPRASSEDKFEVLKRDSARGLRPTK